MNRSSHPIPSRPIGQTSLPFPLLIAQHKLLSLVSSKLLWCDGRYSLRQAIYFNSNINGSRFLGPWPSCGALGGVHEREIEVGLKKLLSYGCLYFRVT